MSGQTGFEAAEFQARRKAALEKIPDGILLLRSYSGLKHWDESGFHQDSSFYYFTGLNNAHSAILVLDGQQKESWLFVAPRQGSLGADLHGFDSIFIAPGPQAEAELRIDHVVLWDELVPFVELRRKNNPKLVLYGDSAGQTGRMSGEGSVPKGLDPMENAHWVWGDMLHRHWPDLETKDAFNLLDEVRSVKSAAELERLRQAARITEKGFWAGVHAIGPGKTQRMVEGKVLDACLEAGSEGPSLWPWVRSGPNTMGSTLFEALADYHNMDRRMQGGEVVRLDVGCDFAMYKGDFGRTIPVSGHFDEGQRETMELLNGAYLAGVSAMRPGNTPKDVFKATLSYVEQHRNGLKTAMAKEAAEDALKRPSSPLHGLGVDMAEGAPKVFQKGNVICYEPLFSAAGQGFFVEDTFLITADGHELISPALPYAPSEIEKSKEQPLTRADDALTLRNKAVVRDFYTTVLIGRDVDASPRFLRPDYIQHNAQVPTGLKGFMDTFRARFAQKLPPDYKRELLDVIGENETVVIYVRQTWTGQDGIHHEALGFDMFRVQDGKIAEHWDAD